MSEPADGQQERDQRWEWEDTGGLNEVGRGTKREGEEGRRAGGVEGGGGVAPSKWALKWQLVWPHVQKNSLQATKAPQKSWKQASALPPCRNRTTHQRTSHTYDQVKEGLGVGREGGGGGEGGNHGGVAVGLATPKNWRLPKKPPPPYPLLTTPSPPLPGPAVPATHNNRQTLILPHEAWHPHQGGPSRGATVKRSGCHHALTVGNVVGVVGVPRYVPWLGVAPSLQPVANSTRSASLKGPTVGCDCISCKVVRAGFQQ